MDAEKARQISRENDPKLDHIKSINENIQNAALHGEWSIIYYLDDIQEYNAVKLLEHYQNNGFIVSKDSEKLYIRW